MNFLKKRFYILIFILLTISPYLFRYLLNNKNIKLVNQIYFQLPYRFLGKKKCSNYDSLLNKSLDNTFSVSIINSKGNIIGEYNQTKLRIPASNLKLLSTGYVINNINIFDTLKTSLFKDKNNNFYIIGSGDPDLLINDVYSLISKINYKTKVNLYLVDINDNLKWPEGWTKTDKLYKYGSPITKLAINSNSSKFININYLKDQLSNYLISKNPYSNIKVSILQNKDINTNKFTLVRQINSNTILSLLTLSNSESHNFTSESLYKNASKSWYNNNYVKLNIWLKNKGLPIKNIYIADASGLSRDNRVTTDLISSFLHKMKSSNNYDYFSSTLSILGVRGTLSKRLVNSKLKGKFLGKTGTLSNVFSLSGYLYKDKEVLSISIIQNSNLLEIDKIFKLLSDIYYLDKCN